jgi:hypothetical protein
MPFPWEIYDFAVKHGSKRRKHGKESDFTNSLSEVTNKHAPLKRVTNKIK